MEYHYISELATKEINPELFQIHKGMTIPYICYHINKECNTPFLQIMLVKSFTDEYSLPYTFLRDEEPHKSIIEQVKLYLSTLNGVEYDNKNIIFDGFIYTNTNSTQDISVVALVNISDIDINSLPLTMDSPVWFSLISEIVNTGTICEHIHISKLIRELFSSNRKLCLLYKDTSRKEFYNIPDASYTMDEMDKVKFKSVFGQTPVNDSYYFYKSVINCLKQTKLNVNDKYGINRYAVFCTLDSYNVENNDNNYDYKIKSYEDFYPLSYHAVITNKETHERRLI